MATIESRKLSILRERTARHLQAIVLANDRLLMVTNSHHAVFKSIREK
jgi:hypothetical protein